MKSTLTFTLLLCIVTIFYNCADSGSKSGETILFPNNDSELTMLMREMYDYYDKLKLDVQKGQLPSKIQEFKEIHEAVATDPAKSSSDLYKAMSTAYLQSAEMIKPSTEDLPKVFNSMVDNCMNCHKQMCPGPMVKIKKLYVQNN